MQDLSTHSQKPIPNRPFTSSFELLPGLFHFRVACACGCIVSEKQTFLLHSSFSFIRAKACTKAARKLPLVCFACVINSVRYDFSTTITTTTTTIPLGTSFSSGPLGIVFLSYALFRFNAHQHRQRRTIPNGRLPTFGRGLSLFEGLRG